MVVILAGYYITSKVGSGRDCPNLQPLGLPSLSFLSLQGRREGERFACGLAIVPFSSTVITARHGRRRRRRGKKEKKGRKGRLTFCFLSLFVSLSLSALFTLAKVKK